MKRAQTGFNIIELMIVLTIAAIVLAIGAPSFQEFRKNNRLTGVANDFLGAVQTARVEAIKRQLPVSVCPSTDPLAAAPICGGRVFKGWIAFVDRDLNCLRTGVEMNAGDLVRVGGSVDAAVNTPSNGTCISFAGTGFTVTAAGNTLASRVLFCDDRGNINQPGTTLAVAREVEIVNVGRSRITREPADIADGSIGAVVACP